MILRHTHSASRTNLKPTKPSKQERRFKLKLYVFRVDYAELLTKIETYRHNRLILDRLNSEK